MNKRIGKNSLDVLTSLGINANAYTSTDHTAYLFECTDNFYEGLDELMDYVQHPYFTDENVEKEKGIISQEIMMYDDYPEWVVYMNAVRCMYEKNPIIIDIAGSIESIKQINKEVLYKCYNTFYHPSNTAMIIIGDFNPEEILKEIKKRLINKKNQVEIKRVVEDEKEEIVNKKAEKNMEVSIPLFMIGIKDKKYENSKQIVQKHIAIEIILNMLIGKSSELYKECYKNGLLMAEPYLEYEFSKSYAYVGITGQSKEPMKILEGIENEIDKMRKKGIDQEHFLRIKNMIYGNYIKEYNNISEIARMFTADYFKGINSFDYLENYEQVTKEFTEEILKEVFNKQKIVISIVKPK